MKVFISHKKEDEGAAKEVLNTLVELKIDAYLDLIEGKIELKGEELTNHIKNRLNDCTDLLVVISEKTRYSWWVPFEIGMASQKSFPIVNYLKAGISLPEYLSYWPRLKSASDLEKYISVKRKVTQQIILEKSFNQKYEISTEKEIERFYKELKSVL